MSKNLDFLALLASKASRDIISRSSSVGNRARVTRPTSK